ncbi:molybdopterin-dependent oxidoreductase [Gemmiger formicilis]|uniref:xanthine dehydrogenase family protein molybdopterin-binding subunit n=1 Tax=Gemmiger formicilis TaxID=745368 RepID=UPI00210AEE28|nr:molybdopterin cofactor-binding domain-containing protein [Gemmiger formicilis]MCQ5080797.1 molybdopterin-dependent oxidoreductase [Gemmiger formicilis]MCQ5116339.1 molybdopterin-dependent oxidoreductase [Gemmiger formicilis]
MKTVNQSMRKKDAMQLVTGQPVYMDDVIPQDCLIVKLLRSPHANAIVQEIDTSRALLVPGIEAIYTWKDVDQQGRRYTQAGQTYPEPSPYDRLVIDRHVRFAGDVVAILAGKDEKCVDKAMKLIKVRYEVLPAVLDYHTALDNPVLVHPEENWESLAPVGADNKRNLCAHDESGAGDIEAVLAGCDVVIDHTYHTRACQQAMMETFRTYCSIDAYGRLNVLSSTQIVFHCRRILANALHIPKSMIRVAKPRIGGGFGAKQTSVCEVYPAFVTWKTKKPSKIIFSRYESQIASTPRHEMELHVRLGATKDGIVRGIDLYTLSNTGAYGEHGPTTVGLSGHKSIPLYGKAEAFRFVSDVVYTNHMSSGAYRGYGATQGLFAVESAVNELADKLGIDPFVIRQRNIVHEGDVMPAYYGQVNTSCALDRCLQAVHDNIGWDEKYPVRDMGNGKVRAVGMGMAMQGSGITSVDVGSASLKINDDGFYTLSIGAADMGTGCDTILAQIAAEVLECPLDNVTVLGADTDSSPYDSGSYASSTTYVTGKAVEQCAEQLKQKICQVGAGLLGLDERAVVFAGDAVTSEDGTQRATLAQIAAASQCGSNTALEAVVTHSSEISPPPFMVGAAEVEVDLETGEAQVIRYEAAVDCGTPVNPNLARVQAEGGILQGIGMALTENVTYDDRGMPQENSLMQYKIPARNDIGHIHVVFESSYEGTGPFGAKSIGEVVINTPLPAVADAIYHATHKRFYELPITREQIALAGQ